MAVWSWRVGWRGAAVAWLRRVTMILWRIALLRRCAVRLLVRGRSVGVVWSRRVLLASLCIVGLRRVLRLTVTLLPILLLRRITTLLLATAVVIVA